jgi:hypothetical protein
MEIQWVSGQFARSLDDAAVVTLPVNRLLTAAKEKEATGTLA